MYRIEKAKETMTSRERVIKTFNYEKTDRVPIDYETNPTIHAKVSNSLGIEPGNYEGFLQALGVDSRIIHPNYVGKLLYKELPGIKVNPVYGFYSRWVENNFGGYDDFCNFPLQDVEDDVIAAFPFPSPDDFDYETALSSFAYYKDLALHVGNAGIGDIINSIGRIMNMENVLVGIITENEAVLDLIDRKLSMELGILDRILDKAKGRIDYVWIGEDLGTQHSPMISKDLYRKILRPRHQKFIDLAKSYSLPIMIHTCGSSSWAYEDFIEMGVDAVDTLQPEATDMSPQYLIEKFGGRLSFHGCISTAGPLAYGTAEDTEEYCRKTLELMMKNGGYHFSPTHQIQDNTPVENVIAMYQAAHKYGVYK
jgi:uroporphyrinogen decarboxylase